MKKIIGLIFAVTLLSSNSFADITFWTTEVQPARMEKQMEMAKSFETKTGKQVWEYEAGGGFTGSPAVSQQRLVIASNDGKVYCFGKK